VKGEGDGGIIVYIIMSGGGINLFTLIGCSFITGLYYCYLKGVGALLEFCSLCLTIELLLLVSI
jgi:hypothetical protein